jgi:hypothetical protein
MVDTPVRANRSINSIFVASGIAFFSFWRPSRGPTSTSLTRLSDDVVLAVANPLCQRNWGRRQALQMLDRARFMVNGFSNVDLLVDRVKGKSVGRGSIGNGPSRRQSPTVGFSNWAELTDQASPNRSPSQTT